MQIKNSTAIITGAASGMGLASAIHLKKQGIKKLILIDLNKKVLEKIKQDLDATIIVADVTDEKNLEAAFLQIKQPANICINCAGIAPAQRIVGKSGPMPLDDFTKVINVNLIGSFNVMRLAATAMYNLSADNQDNERGIIINTASVAAYDGQIGQAAYSASKGGIIALTLPAAREFAKFGIRVVCIAPGLMDTPMMANMPDSVKADLAQTVPFPKRLGKAEEYAKLAAHIIENPLINGETIRLDGALRMQ